MRSGIILMVIVLLAACSASKRTPVSQADVDRGSAQFAGLTLEELQNGEKMYQGNCGKCHPLKNPEKYTKEEWEKIMPNMVQKANKKGGNLGVTDEQLLLRYAVTMAQRP